jgi:hypothetical protein
MAIDSETKRRSVQSYSLPGVLPLADGTVAEGDRAHVSWYYSGMDYDSPTSVTVSAVVQGVRGWLRSTFFKSMR